jgi:hypothetical protein
LKATSRAQASKANATKQKTTFRILYVLVTTKSASHAGQAHLAGSRRHDFSFGPEKKPNLRPQDGQQFFMALLLFLKDMALPMLGADSGQVGTVFWRKSVRCSGPSRYSVLAQAGTAFWLKPVRRCGAIG